MDGDQAREALVGEAEAFHEEQKLRGASRVLDHVVELLSAQDVDVALSEERVWGREGPASAPCLIREEVREVTMGTGAEWLSSPCGEAENATGTSVTGPGHCLRAAVCQRASGFLVCTGLLPVNGSWEMGAGGNYTGVARKDVTAPIPQTRKPSHRKEK